MTKPIVVVGSINIDLVAVCNRMPLPGETVEGSTFESFPGGKGANQAVAVARLGYPVRLIGRIGTDAFGTQLRASLELEGVDLAGVTAVQASSGVAVIMVSGSGENSIVVVQGANAHVTPEYLEMHVDVIRSAGLVLTQFEIPEESVDHLAQICSREHVPLILDPAPARQVSTKLLNQVAWFTPNESEAAFFVDGQRANHHTVDAPLIAKALIDMGSASIVLKMGANGAYLATSDGASESIPPYIVGALDTTAAGDVFNGAFATGLMLGKKPVDSASFAAAAAAISVTRAGAQPSMPVMAEVEQMMESPKRMKFVTSSSFG